MVGTTYHRSLDFDVPFISHIEGNMYMGGCQDGLRLPPNIQNVISLYPWECYEVLHKLESFREVKIHDAGIRPIVGMLEELTEWTLSKLKQGPTLIHCQAGLNRSGLLSALVLVKLGRTPQEAIQLLRERRSPAVLCNPSFERWLLTRASSAPR